MLAYILKYAKQSGESYGIVNICGDRNRITVKILLLWTFAVSGVRLADGAPASLVDLMIVDCWIESGRNSQKKTTRMGGLFLGT